MAEPVEAGIRGQIRRLCERKVSCKYLQDTFVIRNQLFMKYEMLTTHEMEIESGAHWSQMQSLWQEGDEFVRYSDVSTHLNFCSGEEGIALLRNGAVVFKIMTSISG